MSSEHVPQPWEGVLVATLAGAATILGGFSLFLVRRFKPVPFSIALGLAGGVMVYVTLVEIVPETMHLCSSGMIEWESGRENPRTDDRMQAWGMFIGTACVFAGWWLAWFISWVLDACLERCNLVGELNFDEEGILKNNALAIELTNNALETSDSVSADISRSSSEESDALGPVDADGRLVVNECRRRRESHEFLDPVTGEWDGVSALQYLVDIEVGFTRVVLKSLGNVDEGDFQAIQLAHEQFRRDQSKFLRVGLFTAIALGIHNLPEGMATYTSYMEDPTFGFAMAFAIAVHNIPEGIAVAVPVYFGTGSACKALSLCAISAISEPIGAILAWGIKKVNDSDIVDGVMFGFIAGFMLRVAISELMFTGFRYDPTNLVCVKAICLGMAIMGFSLVLFQFAA